MLSNQRQVHDVIEFARVKSSFTGKHEGIVTNCSGGVCEEKILRDYVLCLRINLNLEESIIPFPIWIRPSEVIRSSVNVVAPFRMRGRQVESAHFF